MAAEGLWRVSGDAANNWNLYFSKLSTAFEKYNDVVLGLFIIMWTTLGGVKAEFNSWGMGRNQQNWEST